MNSILKYFLCCLFFISKLTYSQNQAKKWYFGNKAGLDFMSNTPTVLTNGMMTAGEGCSSVSDAAGNILLYTDGMTVYNQSHTVMANGNGLYGSGTSTQASLIVKQPGNSDIYYV